jgi:predicted GNAT family N-acyltransferase
MDIFCCLIEFGTPEFDEALRLRDAVLRQPLGLTYEEADIAAESDNTHIAAWIGDHLVGYLQFAQLDDTTLKMRQVAVSTDIQSKGIGSRLVIFAEAWARRQNHKLIELNARNTAIAFYQKLGYQITEKPFTEVGIAHHKMTKSL